MDKREILAELVALYESKLQQYQERIGVVQEELAAYGNPILDSDTPEASYVDLQDRLSMLRGDAEKVSGRIDGLRAVLIPDNPKQVELGTLIQVEFDGVPEYIFVLPNGLVSGERVTYEGKSITMASADARLCASAIGKTAGMTVKVGEMSYKILRIY